MDSQNEILAQNMAFLLSIPPDSNLGKLLRFCLAANFDEKKSGKSALEFSRALMDDPSSLAFWTHEVLGTDINRSDREWQALAEMGIKDAKEYMNRLSKELENLNL